MLKVRFIKNLKNIRCAVLILVILFLLLSILFIGCSKKPDKYEIWISAKNYVKSNLENPSEARFPSQYKEYIFEIEKDRYEIKAYVIEQIQTDCFFCPTVRRTYFSCTVDYKNGKYIPHSLKFYGSKG